MTSDKPRILIIDDEPIICDLLSEDLIELSYLCDIAGDGDCALQKMAKDDYDIILLDIRLPGMSGIELLKEITSRYDSAVIMITAINDVNTAIVSMKLGAFDYIVKPFSLEKLNSSINTAIEKKSRSVVKSNSNKKLYFDYEERELQEMDAIANGIEVKLDLTDNRSTIVTRKTIEIARELCISDERIIKWVEKRVAINRKNLKILKQFSQNAIAQVKMGMAKEYRIEDNLDKSGN